VSTSERPLAKVILLRHAQEVARRQALAQAAEAEARAIAQERAGEALLRAASNEAAAKARAPGPELASAQLIDVRGRFLRRLQETVADRERDVAALRGERLAAEADARRARRALERDRHARERLEEMLAARRRAAQRAHDQREEAAADDLPPRGGGEGAWLS
jgi:hypothetical protein